MNLKRYPVNNYIPINLRKNDNGKNDTFHDLGTRLKQMTFDEIMKDTDYHFENCFVTNFDLINHECRGDTLNFSRKHYETIFSNNIKKNIPEDLQSKFISSAIRSERRDLHIEKQLLKEHFRKRQKIERDLEKRGVFLSSLRKRAFQKKKTDDCKSLFF